MDPNSTSSPEIPAMARTSSAEARRILLEKVDDEENIPRSLERIVEKISEWESISLGPGQRIILGDP